MKVLHIITWLGHGGAERQLVNLVMQYPKESAIFSIKAPGEISSQVKAADVPLYSGQGSGLFSFQWLRGLKGALREVQPDVVMGWMYHGNLAASLTRAVGFGGPILWNIRHSVADLSREKKTTRLVIRAGAWLRGSPHRVVYNSSRAAIEHEALGYPVEKRVVLPNGFDLTRFNPNHSTGLQYRAALGIPADALLVGLVGRVHAMKNHLGWLEAFKQVRVRYGNVRCVIAGEGVTEQGGSVAAAVQRLQLDDVVTLLPAISAPERLYPALDLLVMPSLWGEGFPNVVGEAMACGVPALVMDVGDAAHVVGETGFVATGGSPEELAMSALDVLGLGAEALASCGRLARQRMEECYGTEEIGKRYRALLESAISSPYRRSG